MRKEAIYGIAFFILFIALGILSFRLLTPPKPVPADANPTVFSAERAMQQLEVIAAEPHSPGTPAHDSLRRYLVQQLSGLGLEVSVQDTTGIRHYGTVRAGRARNILARLPGTGNGKTVLVMSHYDSQPNTPGAADDGSGVAAMLETIRALRAEGSTLQNDVLFLVTDLEEVGLLGAEAFLHAYPDTSEIAVVLNFEARGNRGVSFTFEVSPQNGWAVKQYAKAAPHTFANSLAYEIYQRMPNDSDFSVFRQAGYTGLNSAFIDGYVNYHSMTDTPENISRASLQHQGEYMLNLVRHFGNIDLSETKAPDIIYFNPAGSWLVYYPVSWDWPLIGLTILLFLATLFLGVRRQRVLPLSVLTGAGLYLLALLVSNGLVYFLARGIREGYTHYGNFYTHNFYNAPVYLIAFLGLCLAVFGIIYRLAFRRFKAESLLLGALTVNIAGILVLKTYLGTAAYLIYYPTAFASLGLMLLFFLHIRRLESPRLYGTTYLLATLPAIGLWVPFIYIFYIVFSLEMPGGSTAIFCLLLGLAIPILRLAEQWKFPIVPLTGLLALFAGLLIGHLQSRPQTDRPLQTNLNYVLDTESDQALWVSVNPQLDSWSEQYLGEKRRESFSEVYPGTSWQVWKSSAPKVKLLPVEIDVWQDSLLADSSRRLGIKIIPRRRLASLECFVRDVAPPSLARVQGRKVEGEELRRFIYFAPPMEGVSIELETDILDSPLPLQIIEHSWGLPGEIMARPLPPEMIYGPGYYSNAIHLKTNFQIYPRTR